MTKGGKLLTDKPGVTDVDAFLAKAAAIPVNKVRGERGRLLFALDATASRRPTWDISAEIQSEMFLEAAALGGLEMQLAFFRGFGEFKVSPWLDRPEEFMRLMTSVSCLAGETQIAKVLQHAVNEAGRRKVNAMVYVGDCLEEDIDRLGALAGELGLLGVPAFMFHEGNDPLAVFGFKQIARLSGGACCGFDAGSAHVLRDLLSAVAVYAAGGRPALESIAKKRGGALLKLTHQMKES